MTFELGAERREEVDRRLQRFRTRYGEVPVASERVETDPEDFERRVELARDGWLGEAGAWVTDDDGRVLLVRHENAPDRWEVLGGRHESGETHEETARREVRERTGVEVEPTSVYRVGRKEFVHAGKPDRRLHVLTVIFEADARATDIDETDDELLDVQWFAAPPEEGVHGFLEGKVTEWTGE